MFVYKALAVIILLFVIGVSIAPYLKFENLVLEGLIQFKPHVAVFILCVALILAFSKLYILSLLSLVCASVGLITSLSVFTFVSSPKSCSGEENNLRVMTHNIYHLNTNYQAILNNIHSINPDILHIQEYKGGIYNYAHKELTKIYPYSHLDLKGGIAQGGTFYSKFPIQSARRKWMGSNITQAQIKVGELTLNFIGVHAISPKSTERVKERNAFIRTLTVYIQDMSRSNDLFVIVGDFNSAPWHPLMKKMQVDTGLKAMPILDYMRVGGTWPADWPRIASVPIDNIYHNETFDKAIYNNGLRAYSDHISLYADLAYCNK